MSTPSAIVFSDFDGTITLSDSNDYLVFTPTDTLGFGPEKRIALGTEVLYERMSFRQAFQEMLDSIKTPFPECIKILRKNIKLDPGFRDFHDWCLSKNIPVIIVSSGMEPMIKALLTDLVGPKAEDIEIISNDVKINEDGSWDIVFRDESDFGHDKSRCIRPYAKEPAGQRPHLFYCGDGVSDLSAARETDLLFAKKGKDLILYCERENVPFTVFDDFKTIHSTVDDIVHGKTTIKEATQNGEKVAQQVLGKETNH